VIRVFLYALFSVPLALSIAVSNIFLPLVFPLPNSLKYKCRLQLCILNVMV